MLMLWICRAIFEKACDWSQILTGEMSISEIRGFISGPIYSLINRRTDTGWDMEIREMVGRALRFQLGSLGADTSTVSRKKNEADAEQCEGRVETRLETSWGMI
jgi:hypothetical protein